ncbi:MAG: NAD(P)H-binding protein [Anaerolineaceae bacterium]|nr:MAG: NAD(P)H-binding protein [Anaerolineaceae bacterium]
MFVRIRAHPAKTRAVQILTILRPSGLTDGAMTGTYAIGENIKGESSRIARADVAQAIIKELDEKVFVCMVVTNTNEQGAWHGSNRQHHHGPSLNLLIHRGMGKRIQGRLKPWHLFFCAWTRLRYLGNRTNARLCGWIDL